MSVNHHLLLVCFMLGNNHERKSQS